mmetsp:Transcript_86552/g.258306  ORF Transcript_86552/g.258306 Transcript_86552/m.258306 type:complete len:461 (-) Transcript_86552:92-1474(-)
MAPPRFVALLLVASLPVLTHAARLVRQWHAADRQSKGVLPTGWICKNLYSRGTYGVFSVPKERFNQKIWAAGTGIVRRQCNDCSPALKEVYFKRKSDPTTWDYYEGLLVTWRGDVGFHSDFDIYPTLEDALAGTNFFQFCNGNDQGIGFPRDCGPLGPIGNQWTSLTKGGRRHYSYSVYAPKLSGAAGSTEASTTSLTTKAAATLTSSQASKATATATTTPTGATATVQGSTTATTTPATASATVQVKGTVMTTLTTTTSRRAGSPATIADGMRYVSFGCFHSPEHSQTATELTGGSHVSGCFAKCLATSGGSYFGLTRGNMCWCGGIVESKKVEDEECDAQCGADSPGTCGGPAPVSSVYRIIKCHRSTSAPKAFKSPYASFKGRSCGRSRSNRHEIRGEETLIGSIDDCKAACTGDPSMMCHGFTYEEDLSRCTFHFDVNDGKVKKKESLSCHFKLFR